MSGWRVLALWKAY